MPNTEYIEREFEAYRKDESEARAILDRAAEEKRSTTAEEDERFDALTVSAEVHKRRADKLAEMDKGSTELAEAVRSRIGDVADEDSGQPEGDKRTQDRRIVEEVRAIIDAKQRGGSVPAEVNFDLDWDEERIESVRAIANFSDSASLYTSDFSTRVAVYQRTLSPWLGQATVITADNGRPLILPNLTVDVTGYEPGEGTAITESTPTLGTVTATPAGYKALSYVSMETEEDEMIGLMQLISQSHGRQLGLDFGSATTTAVLAAATNGGTATGLTGTGTTTFFGYEDLLDLKYGRAAPYRLVGSWVMSNGAIKKVRKFKDSNGQYYWQSAIAAGQPPTFDDAPVFEDPFLAAPASATKSVVFGDLSAYVVKQRPLRFAVSTEYRFNTDQVALKSVYRAGGALADAIALAYLVSANT